MLKSNAILYSKGGNDECMTPRYAVEPLLEFIPKGTRIWCPFDTTSSEYVKVFREAGFQVIPTHISQGYDFQTYAPDKDKWDMIISNPPFTKKKETFQRALWFGRPFCLLMSNTWLNDSAIKLLFKDKDLQLLMFDKRIQFGNQVQKGITFSSSYYCYNFLPKQIVIRQLNIPGRRKK